MPEKCLNNIDHLPLQQQQKLIEDTPDSAKKGYNLNYVYDVLSLSDSWSKKCSLSYKTVDYTDTDIDYTDTFFP